MPQKRLATATSESRPWSTMGPVKRLASAVSTSSTAAAAAAWSSVPTKRLVESPPAPPRSGGEGKVGAVKKTSTSMLSKIKKAFSNASISTVGGGSSDNSRRPRSSASVERRRSLATSLERPLRSIRQRRQSASSSDRARSAAMRSRSSAGAARHQPNTTSSTSSCSSLAGTRPAATGTASTLPPLHEMSKRSRLSSMEVLLQPAGTMSWGKDRSLLLAAKTSSYPNQSGSSTGGKWGSSAKRRRKVVVTPVDERSFSPNAASSMECNRPVGSRAAAGAPNSPFSPPQRKLFRPRGLAFASAPREASPTYVSYRQPTPYSPVKRSEPPAATTTTSRRPPRGLPQQIELGQRMLEQLPGHPAPDLPQNVLDFFRGAAAANSAGGGVPDVRSALRQESWATNATADSSSSSSRRDSSVDNRSAARDRKIRDLTQRMCTSPAATRRYRGCPQCPDCAPARSGAAEGARSRRATRVISPIRPPPPPPVAGSARKKRAVGRSATMVKPARMKGSDLTRPKTLREDEMASYLKRLEAVRPPRLDERDVGTFELNLTVGNLAGDGGERRRRKRPAAVTGSSAYAVATRCQASSKKSRGPDDDDKVEKALGHWRGSLAGFAERAAAAVERAAADLTGAPAADLARLRAAVAELQVAAAGLPKDLEAALEAEAMQAKISKAWRWMEDEDFSAAATAPAVFWQGVSLAAGGDSSKPKKRRKTNRDSSSLDEVAELSRSNLGVPESADPLTCDRDTARRISAAEMFAPMGEIGNVDIYGKRRGRCNNCTVCDAGFISFHPRSKSGGGDARRVLCLYCNCPPAFHSLVSEEDRGWDHRPLASAGHRGSSSSVVSSASSATVRERVRDFEERRAILGANRN